MISRFASCPRIDEVMGLVAELETTGAPAAAE